VVHQTDRALSVYDDFVAERNLAGSAAATAGNKKPDIIIGLRLARQAGNSVWLILRWTFVKAFKFFLQGPASVAC
jgi:hypothetical protein